MTTYIATLRLSGRKVARGAIVTVRETHTSNDPDSLKTWAEDRSDYHRLPIAELKICPVLLEGLK